MDLENNVVTRAWCEGTADRMEIEVDMTVDRLRDDPFACILGPEIAHETRYHGAPRPRATMLAAWPERTMPVSGAYLGDPVSIRLDFSVEIDASDEMPRTSAGHAIRGVR